MPKWVDLNRFDTHKGVYEPVVRAMLTDDGLVVLEGHAATVAELERGIESQDGRLLRPSDGDAFLTELVRIYDNPMSMQASDVQEGQPPSPLTA